MPLLTCNSGGRLFRRSKPAILLVEEIGMTKAPDLFSLKGKTALVTGGSMGIGRSIARGLGEAGARLIITARKEGLLREAEALLREEGLDVVGVVADIARADSIG